MTKNVGLDFGIWEPFSFLFNKKNTSLVIKAKYFLHVTLQYIHFNFISFSSSPRDG